MPRPRNERKQWEEERAELPAQIAALGARGNGGAMSKASEWANTLKPVEAARPCIDFRPLDEDDDYIVTALVGTHKTTGDAILTFESSDESQPPALRGENAIALAYWILETFGDAPDTIDPRGPKGTK